MERPTAERGAFYRLDRVARALTVPDPDPMPWRAVLPTWSEERRERWGRKANELEGAGLGWRDAEQQAFDEISNP